MNILHLTHTDIPSDSRILKEMESLANSKSQYKVKGVGIKEINTNPEEVPDIIEVYSLSLFSRKLRFLPGFIRHTLTFMEMNIKLLLKALTLKPKIIHCHDVLVLPVGVLAKFFTRSKLIYDAHELESQKNNVRRTLGKVFFSAEYILWRFIDALIVVSPSIGDWYHDNIGKKNTVVILNSPILENRKNQGTTEYLREHFNIPKDSRIFLYIGILMNGRGIDLIVDAFKQKNLTSSLVLLGYGILSEDLKVIASEQNNIYVHDSVPHEKVVGIAKSADIGLCYIQNVSLSDYYCLPNKLFEYAFSEIPVLASDFPEITRIVKEYNLGVCSAVEPDKIYDAIKEFENMESLPKIASKDLFELSWHAQEIKLLKLYKNLDST